MQTPSTSTTNAETIEYATASTSLGIVLVATSIRGACAILLGSDARSLVADLRRRFPTAELIRRNSESLSLVKQVVDAIESPMARLGIPLDLRGSDFQRSVWQALREIPVGSTATYKEVAQRIGPAVMAKDVGEACAANALAVVIPCHRVIRTDGSLAGYRWGVKRKQALLDKERQVTRDAKAVERYTDRINRLFAQNS